MRQLYDADSLAPDDQHLTLVAALQAQQKWQKRS